jgi:arabinofuranosyltransferase
MFTFFVTCGLAAEGGTAAGVALALAALTRPEGVLVAAVVGIWRTIVARRVDLRFGLTFAAIWAPYFAWRWWYYGWMFPNTFYVKAGGTPPPGYTAKMLHHGLYYVWQWAWQSRALFAVPLVALAVWRRPRWGLCAVALTVIYLAYTVSVGGDFIGLHRFVLPLFVTTAVLAAQGIEALADLVRWPTPLFAVPFVLGYALSEVPVTREALIPVADGGGTIDRPGFLKLYAEDREKIGRALAPLMRPDDFSVVGGVGVQPYYARMRAVDVFGLVSEDIAHNEPPVRDRPGHQKWARTERVLSYHPTFIMSCYDLHREPTSYRLCGEAATFMKNGYEPTTMHIPGLRERGEYYTFLRRKDRPWP